MTVINSNGKWILRVARFSDFQAISSFHSEGTFESLDYMPVTYHQLLQDKNSNAFVATTCDGKVVSTGGLIYFIFKVVTTNLMAMNSTRSSHNTASLFCEC